MNGYPESKLKLYKTVKGGTFANFSFEPIGNGKNKVLVNWFIPSPFIIEPGKHDPDIIRKELEAGRYSGIGEIVCQLAGFAPNDRHDVPIPKSLWKRDILYNNAVSFLKLDMKH